uniref:R3H domain-containing protein n=2 Tax=Spongospora subterranea TaxID=70186 RepID=A0A0H5R4Z3_9EUKA|eukprot:CRZ09218.1 hypothetical protein [Spongospora subterranea]
MLDPFSSGPSTGGNPVSDEGDNDAVLDPIVTEAITNERDRTMILQFESRIEAFIEDKSRVRLSFPPMSSYHRLILHKIAEYYRIDHPSQLLPDGKRQIVLLKQIYSRVPQVRICDMESGVSPTAQLAPSAAIPPAPARQMRIMRRSDVVRPPSASNQPTPNDTDQSLQSREEAYAKARAKLFEFEDPEECNSSQALEEAQYNMDNRRWDIEPHEQDLYRRNVGVYDRSTNVPPSVYYTPPSLSNGSSQWDAHRPASYSSSNPQFWNPPMHPMAHAVHISEYSHPSPATHPRQSLQSSLRQFPSSLQNLFVNDSKVDNDVWDYREPQRDQQRNGIQDYSFCTSMLEVYDLPHGAKNYQIDVLLENLKQRRCSLSWLPDNRIIAVFESASEALTALQQIKDPKYKLRPFSGAT